MCAAMATAQWTGRGTGRIPGNRDRVDWYHALMRHHRKDAMSPRTLYVLTSITRTRKQLVSRTAPHTRRLSARPALYMATHHTYPAIMSEAIR